MDHRFERWNTPWRVLQHSLAEERFRGTQPHAAEDSQQSSTSDAAGNWLLRARGARTESGQSAG